MDIDDRYPPLPRWVWVLTAITVSLFLFSASQGWLDDQELRRPGSTTTTTQEVTP